MDDLEKTFARWWATTRPTFLFTGAELHVSDSPKPQDWSLMYRWQIAKEAAPPAVALAAGLAVIAGVTLVPSVTFWGQAMITPVLVVVAVVALVCAGFLARKARRKPFSVITLPVACPETIREQLEELWPELEPAQREALRKDMISTFESRKKWSPQALQQAEITRIERARHRALSAF